METMKDLNIELIRITRDSGFDGYEIIFTIEGQRYCFLTGNTKRPFPLNVKHQFTVKEPCNLCGRTIYAAPFGHQLCTYFGSNKGELLQYFQKNYGDRFL
ncbi:hypothetical protein [Peribacillus deserti]|uniref:Uncharacterized protein n=1 Tax=Peribacillus deserti TaxID=673318 RepID=A0A2N5LZL9_9BACI|nr:hypothetical protein [Peribacillus deserti]PLT27541.1 hypothetical protein CUU66_23325 [Peribacillus deserti]